MYSWSALRLLTNQIRMAPRTKIRKNSISSVPMSIPWKVRFRDNFATDLQDVGYTGPCHGGALVAAAQHALYLRSVYASCDALQALGRHPPPCMLLKIRLIVDSSPTSGAIQVSTLSNLRHRLWSWFFVFGVRLQLAGGKPARFKNAVICELLNGFRARGWPISSMDRIRKPVRR